MGSSATNMYEPLIEIDYVWRLSRLAGGALKQFQFFISVIRI
jgi:hypothetical protein